MSALERVLTAERVCRVRRLSLTAFVPMGLLALPVRRYKDFPLAVQVRARMAAHVYRDRMLSTHACAFRDSPVTTVRIRCLRRVYHFHVSMGERALVIQSTCTSVSVRVDEPAQTVRPLWICVRRVPVSKVVRVRLFSMGICVRALHRGPVNIVKVGWTLVRRLRAIQSVQRHASMAVCCMNASVLRATLEISARHRSIRATAKDA